MFLGAFVFLDLETTGATAGTDRITEIGLISVKDGNMKVNGKPSLILTEVFPIISN